MKFLIFFFASFCFASVLAVEDKRQIKRDVITFVDPVDNFDIKELLDDEDCDEFLEPIVKEVMFDEQILPKVTYEKFGMDKLKWDDELKGERFLNRPIYPYLPKYENEFMRNFMRRRFTMEMRDRLMRLFDLNTPLEMKSRINPLYHRYPFIGDMFMKNSKFDTLYNFPRSYPWIPEPYKRNMYKY